MKFHLFCDNIMIKIISNSTEQLNNIKTPLECKILLLDIKNLYIFITKYEHYIF